MAGEITYEMLTKTPFVTGLVSEIPTTLNFFQTLLGLTPGSPNSRRVLGRAIGWDVFNNTRTVANARPPKVGPDTRTPQPVGHRTATLPRFYESELLLAEEIFAGRPLGGNFGTIDESGLQYIRSQMSYLKQRIANAREFMCAHMLRGGFGVDITENEKYQLVAKGSGDFDVDYGVAATHLTTLDLGTGSGLLSGAWQTASTDIISECNNISAAFVRITGRPLRHVVINTSTYNKMLENTQLVTVAGSSVRPFDTFVLNPARTDDNLRVASGGFTVIFRGMPNFLFHVYDGVLSNNNSDATTTTSVMDKLVPDNKAYFLPEIDGSWVQGAEGSEPVRETLTSPIRTAYGFNSWTRPVDTPPGLEMHMLDNFMPLLINPNAIGYGTVSA